MPTRLLSQADQFIGKDAIPSRNALIVAALEHFLAELEREDIDRQFAEMSDDPGYLAFSEEFSESFAESDWRNRNYLLNVSPTAEDSIPQPCAKRLEATGA